MTWRQPERIYGVRELTRILTLTPKRAAQLRRLELLRGESGYTFRDLLALRAANALLDAGASVRQIKQTLAALRRQNPSLVEPLVELRLVRSEEHTSELQSRLHLVCRLLLEKKKQLSCVSKWTKKTRLYSTCSSCS